MLRFGLVFLTLTMSIGVNMDEGFIARLGVDPTILLAALIALITTGLIVQRHLALIVVVAVMAIGSNVPIESAAEMGYDPDYLLAGLVALILAPIVGSHLNFNFGMS